MFLISKSYFAHLDGLSAEHVIPDLLCSEISFTGVSFMSVTAVYHCAQLVYFSNENIILSFKTSP